MLNTVLLWAQFQHQIFSQHWATYTMFNFSNQDGYYTNVGEVGSNDMTNAGVAYNVTEKKD